MPDDIEAQLHTLLRSLVTARPDASIPAVPQTRRRLHPGPRGWWTVTAAVATAAVVALALASSAPIFGHPGRRPTTGATGFSTLFYPKPNKPAGPGSVPFANDSRKRTHRDGRKQDHLGVCG